MIYLEACRAPVHKVDFLVQLDGGNCSIDIFRNYITAIQEAYGHVFSIAGITLDHLVVRFKAVLGKFLNCQPLMPGLAVSHQGSIGGQGEVDSWVGNQVGLKLCHVHIESSIKPKRSCDGRDNLGNEPVQVGVGRSRHS